MHDDRLDLKNVANNPCRISNSGAFMRPKYNNIGFRFPLYVSGKRVRREKYGKRQRIPRTTSISGTRVRYKITLEDVLMNFFFSLLVVIK